MDRDHQTAHCVCGAVGGEKERPFCTACLVRTGRYHFYKLKKKKAKWIPRCQPFLPQEETLCPYSAAQHPARGSCLPGSQPRPSTCLPSWRPDPTSGLPACARPTGPTAGSSSSLKPPVSGRASTAAPLPPPSMRGVRGPGRRAAHRAGEHVSNQILMMFIPMLLSLSTC